MLKYHAQQVQYATQPLAYSSPVVKAVASPVYAAQAPSVTYSQGPAVARIAAPVAYAHAQPAVSTPFKLCKIIV
jgi:hypothetical protein